MKLTKILFAACALLVFANAGDSGGADNIWVGSWTTPDQGEFFNDNAGCEGNARDCSKIQMNQCFLSGASYHKFTISDEGNRRRKNGHNSEATYRYLNYGGDSECGTSGCGKTATECGYDSDKTTSGFGDTCLPWYAGGFANDAYFKIQFSTIDGAVTYQDCTSGICVNSTQAATGNSACKCS